MFLIERLSALVVYCLILLVVCLLIERKKSNYKIILFVYTIVLAVMGFFYVPYKTADLYRIYEYLDVWEHYSWDYFFHNRLNGNILEIDRIYYWLIAQTGEHRLLPAITAFICYSCVFYIICRTAKIYEISRVNIAIAVFFFMSTGSYMGTIGGIRGLTGISLLSLLFFRESIEKKFRIWHILLYVIAGFIHNFAFVLIVFRLLLPIFFKKISAIKKILYITLIFVWAGIVIYFTPDYIKEVVDKAEAYITGDLYTNIWGYGIGIICLAIIFYGMLNWRKEGAELRVQFKEYTAFITGCIIVAVALCFEYSIYARTILEVIPFLFVPLLMILLKNKKDKGRFRFDILILTSLLLVGVCLRGEINGLKFFVLQ